MKKLFTLALVLSMSLSLAACGGSADKPADTAAPAGTSAPADTGKDAPEANGDVVKNAHGVNVHANVDVEALQVASVPKNTGSFWFDGYNIEGAAWAEEHGATQTWFGPLEFDSQAQMNSINDAIAFNPDILSICPISLEAVDEAFLRAQEQGTLCISMEGQGMTNNTFDILYYDDYEYGAHFADIIAETIGEDAKYSVWVGRLTTPCHIAWATAFDDYVAKTYPEMESVTGAQWTEGYDSADQSYEICKQLLQTYEDVDVIITMSAGNMSGISRAITEMGLIGEVFATGGGSPSASHDGIFNGSIIASSIYYPGDAQAAAYEIGRRYLAGEEIKTGDDLGVHNFHSITVAEDGKTIIGDGWIDLTTETFQAFSDQYPGF